MIKEFGVQEVERFELLCLLVTTILSSSAILLNIYFYTGTIVTIITVSAYRVLNLKAVGDWSFERRSFNLRRALYLLTGMSRCGLWRWLPVMYQYLLFMYECLLE